MLFVDPLGDKMWQVLYIMLLSSFFLPFQIGALSIFVALATAIWGSDKFNFVLLYKTRIIRTSFKGAFI